MRRACVFVVVVVGVAVAVAVAAAGGGGGGVQVLGNLGVVGETWEKL